MCFDHQLRIKKCFWVGQIQTFPHYVDLTSNTCYTTQQIQFFGSLYVFLAFDTFSSQGKTNKYLHLLFQGKKAKMLKK